MAFSFSDRLFWQKSKKFYSEIQSQDQKAELRSILSSNLKAFYQYYFPRIEPYKYIDNWHVDAICYHLQGVMDKEIKRLIINVPPAFSKTGIASISLTPFGWTRDPALRFIYGSQDEKLTSDCSRRSRDLILEKSYYELFNVFLKKDAQGKELFVNDKFGYRLAMTVTGGVTGFRGNVIVAEDINDKNKVHSAALREPPIRWISNTVATRVVDEDSAIVNVQQRTHLEDATGFWLSKDDPDVVHLNLPMEYDEARKCITFFGGKKWEDPRKEQGELLWGARFDRDFCTRMRRTIGENEYATQYQQFPAPEEGGIFKKDFWKWKVVRGEAEQTKIDLIYQSWDTALTTGQDSCYSVCVTAGLVQNEHKQNRLILLGVYREKLEYPDLRHMAQRLYMDYKSDYIDHDTKIHKTLRMADCVLVEEAVSGFGLVSDLERAGVRVIGVKPKHYGSKPFRARRAASLIRSGAFLLPAREMHGKAYPTPYSEILLRECSLYKGLAGESNDVVDAMSQLLLYLNETGEIYNPSDEDFVKDNKRNYDIPLVKHLGE